MWIHFKNKLTTFHIWDSILSGDFTKKIYHFCPSRETAAHFRRKKPCLYVRQGQAVSYLPLWIEEEVLMEFSISQSNDDAGCPVSWSNNTDPLSSSCHTKKTPSALGVSLFKAAPSEFSIVRINTFSFETGSCSSMKKNMEQTLRGNMFCFWVAKSCL